MNAEELITEKRDEIFNHWSTIKSTDDNYEDHPSREWLDEHCVITDIASEIPGDVKIVDKRVSDCIELFRDFEIQQLNHDTLEYIDIGHAWDFVEWDGELTVEQSYGPYDGFEQCLEHAVDHAIENNLTILQYTSIISFDNLRYRSLID